MAKVAGSSPAAPTIRLAGLTAGLLMAFGHLPIRLTPRIGESNGALSERSESKGTHGVMRVAAT